jgi:hypothetical protein
MEKIKLRVSGLNYLKIVVVHFWSARLNCREKNERKKELFAFSEKLDTVKRGNVLKSHFNQLRSLI